ncbi:MAG TPA: osmotically inducible protein C [Ktedonobacter sp.]|nr:osmotically inducible protein C [Ktedonobacter sp.]
MSNVRNGVNVDQLIGTIETLKNNPEQAHIHFRAKNEWVNGAYSRTTIQRGPFILEGDEPAALCGSNAAPNPVEAVLHALASCLAIGVAYNAAARDIQIDGLEFDLEGDIDLHGFLGLSEQIRPGYQNIRVSYRVKSDAPHEKLEELFAYVQKTSPVLDIISHPIPVSMTRAE